MIPILGVLFVAMLAAAAPTPSNQKKKAKVSRKAKKLAAKGTSANAAFAKQAQRAGVELGRELNALEKTFMCPQLLEDPELFPDTTASRCAVCVPLEVPLTFTNGRASGMISRDVFNHFVVDGAVSEAIESPRFTCLSNAGALDEWTASPDLPDHQGSYDQLNNFNAASTESTFLLRYGQWTDTGGEPVEPQYYPLTFAPGNLVPEYVVGVPAIPAASMSVRWTTADTSVGRWTVSALTLSDNLDGTYTLVETPSAAITGGAVTTGNAIGTVALPAGTVAWIGFIVTNTLASTASLQLPLTVTCTLGNISSSVGYPVGGGSSFNFLRQIADACRITGFAFHLRNDTPEIYRQGELVAWQQRDDAVGPIRSVEVLSSLKGRYAGRLAEGGYGWMTLRSATNAETSVHIPWQAADADAEQNGGFVDTVHWAVKVADATNQTLVWVLYPVVEYRTDNPFLDVQVGLCSITACEMLANILAHYPAIMNNDSHWQEIKNFLGDTWGKLWSAATPFIRDVAIPAAGSALIAAL